MSERLVADFELRYPAGATVHAQIDQPAQGPHVTVLFGPSGSGKSTILRCVAGLLQPQRGFIQFGQRTWFDAERRIHLPPQKRGIGYLFQDYALFPHLRVAGNIGYALGLWPSRSRRRRISELMDTLGLTGLEQRYPRQLSAGQQQRVALARAVAPKPRLLLLDEPLSALDAPARQALRRELRGLLAQFGTPAVVVTHDPIEAISLADDAVVLRDGRVLQRGPIDEVFSKPSDPAVAAIVGIETIHPAEVISIDVGLATLQVGSARLLAVASGIPLGPATICIRGEDVILERGSETQTSARNRLPATVVSLLPEGPLVRVALDCGFALTALVTRPASEQLQLRPQDDVFALIKAPSIHVLPR